MPAHKGAHLTARLHEDDKNHWTISVGIPDRIALPDSLRFVYKGHWQLKEQHAPVPEEPAAQAIAHAALPERPRDSSVKPRGERRVFRSFRRRVTHR